MVHKTGSRRSRLVLDEWLNAQDVSFSLSGLPNVCRVEVTNVAAVARAFL